MKSEEIQVTIKNIPTKEESKKIIKMLSKYLSEKIKRRMN
jgi:F0F1-type ATP synthase delta subunit